VHLCEGGVQDVSGGCTDERAGVLGHRDEAVGDDHYAFSVLPTDQRLDSEHVSGDADLGLVVQHQLAVLQGSA